MPKKSEPDTINVAQLDDDVRELIRMVALLQSKLAQCKVIEEETGNHIDVKTNTSFESAHACVLGSLAGVNKFILEAGSSSIENQVAHFFASVIELQTKKELAKQHAVDGAIQLHHHSQTVRAGRLLNGYIRTVTDSIDQQLAELGLGPSA